MSRVVGEINFSRTNGDVEVRRYEHAPTVEMSFGSSLWVIMNRDQAVALKEKLEAIFDGNSDK